MQLSDPKQKDKHAFAATPINKRNEKQTMTETMTHPTAEEIALFMRHELARQLNVNQAEIDQDTPFVDLGMSSRDAVTLVGQLEDKFCVHIEASAAWDHPTIKDMSAHLLSLVNSR
ncbi:acyl carrier protein [Yoonia sp. R2-816]|uniref:acyl carrier protein n=2 Tax=Rhodobacterales TaxID=204455 RepID=UPI00372CEDC2